MRARRLRLPLAAACVASFAVPATGGVAGAEAASRKPNLKKVACVPKSSPACRGGRVQIGRQVQLSGTRLAKGMRVTFRWSLGALASKLERTKVGWVVRVPPGTRAGKVRVYVTDKAGRRSNQRTITVSAPAGPPKPIRIEAGVLPEAFRGDGMWIWMLEQSNGGNLQAIAQRAKSAGMKTVFVKSGDGTTDWEQFTPQMVSTLKAAGLRVCAWHFVYGKDPIGEAQSSQRAIDDGADCFVIDAEGQYDARYSQAQSYMRSLRASAGQDYPIGLTSFPYVDYHPKFPYSAFMDPGGGAQANVPQVYWKDIGGKVDSVSARTVAHNRIFKVPLAPLGQAYQGPAPADVRRFRALWAGYGAQGVSWWSWQAALPTTWSALAEPPPAPIASPDPGWPALAAGARSDQVIWLQQHLASAQPGLSIDGRMGPPTVRALKAFQSSRGLQPTGETDAATWQAVLALPFTPVDWAATGSPWK